MSKDITSRETQITILADEGPPDTLRFWCWQTMLASYPKEDLIMVWGDTLHYLGWLALLPVKEKPCTRS